MRPALLPALLLLAQPAPAQDWPSERLRPGIGAADPRQPVAADAAPWASLGRVQTELGGRCTGALIAPRLVLTAAHCLLAPASGQFLQPRSVHVLLAYDRGRHAGHARVEAFEVAPDYRPGSASPGADWALLRLERPLAAPPLPLRRDPPPPRTPLMLGGWQQDRPEALLADTGCRLLGQQRDAAGRPVLLHDCAGTRGASGAPLLMREADGSWAVIGVQSAMAGGIALGQAAPVAAAAEALAATPPPR